MALPLHIRPMAVAGWLLGILLLAATGAAALAGFARHVYDPVIDEWARARQVDPLLVRALIWRESRFHRARLGSRGEAGLMQVTEQAARDWADALGHAPPFRADLLQPELNIRVGTWYLGRALRHWRAKSNPLPYALAEYNAGRAAAQRWAAGDRGDPNAFWHAIGYPGTRRYVQAVLTRYRRLGR